MKLGQLNSVTILDEISSPWQNLKSPCQFYDFLFSFCTLWCRLLYANGEIFIEVNGQILRNNRAIWSPCNLSTITSFKL